MRVMQKTKFLGVSALVAALLAACSAVKPPDPAPAFNKRWSSNADGFIFSAGYFTQAEVDDKRFEAARRAYFPYVDFCKNARLVGRDVIWFDPALTGGNRCARIIYSFACPVKRPEWGASLAYTRREEALREIEKGIGPDCGNKFAVPGSRPSVDRRVQLRDERDRMISADARCISGDDRQQGQIRIGAATRIAETILIAPAFDRLMPSYWDPDGSRFWIEGSARTSGAVHAVFSERKLPDDGANIFLTTSYADDGDGYCVSLTATQGAAAWRKTIRRTRFVQRDSKKFDMMGHSLDPQHYWTPDSDIHQLAEELALAMGLPVMAKHEVGQARTGTGPPATGS